jgi:hypothetical protein
MQRNLSNVTEQEGSSEWYREVVAQFSPFSNGIQNQEINPSQLDRSLSRLEDNSEVIDNVISNSESRAEASLVIRDHAVETIS